LPENALLVAALILLCAADLLIRLNNSLKNTKDPE
jgi:hypothetical protein